MSSSGSTSKSHPSSPMTLRSRDKKPIYDDIRRRQGIIHDDFKIEPSSRLNPSSKPGMIQKDDDSEDDVVDVETVESPRKPINQPIIGIYPDLNQVPFMPRDVPRPQTNPSPVPRAESQRNTGSLFGSWTIVIGAIFITVLALGYFYMRPGPQPNSVYSFHLSEVFGEFQTKWKSVDFSRKFPNQGDRAWRMVRSVVKATTALQEPEYPGVLTLVSLSGFAESTSNCLARRLADVISKSYNDSAFVDISFKKIAKASRSVDALKKTIDDLIQKALSRNDNHVVLLEGLQALPPEAGILLHGFCDNQNAPFKQAIFIITSVVNDDELRVPESDVQVTSFWRGKLDEDKRNSLETRIGNNPIFVKPESAETLDRTCTL